MRSEVREHIDNQRPCEYMFITDQYTWANMPAALTEFGGYSFGRVYAHIQGFTQCRIKAFVFTAGYAGCELRGQYYDGAAWQYLGATGNTPAIVCDADNQHEISAWTTMAAGALTASMFRIAGYGGDGIVDPVFYKVSIEFR